MDIYKVIRVVSIIIISSCSKLLRKKKACVRTYTKDRNLGVMGRNKSKYLEKIQINVGRACTYEPVKERIGLSIIGLQKNNSG